MNFFWKRPFFKITTAIDAKDIALRLFNVAILLLILLNVSLVLLESIQAINTRYHQQFELLRKTSLIAFTVEYLLRIGYYKEYRSAHCKRPLAARFQYLLTPLMLIDLIVIVPFYLHIRTIIDFRLLRLFRLLSLLQVTRNSPTLQMLLTVIKRESRTLIETFMIIVVILILVSAIIFAIEHSIQPDTFASIPHAMWWTIATLTTVGYGDVVPQTMHGKFFGMLVMFIGIAMFAIPTGILVSSFYQEVKRKDFIATWDLVAQVPYFSQLNAHEIASITDLLRLHVVRSGEIIFKQGDQPNSMYFIVSGEVEINRSGKLILCKGGDFFGEIGILYKTPRTATVSAKTYVELLQLDLRDMELFLETHPQLRKHILEQAQLRFYDNP